METLKLGAPLETREARVLLDPTLTPGAYRLELVVVSARGDSAPARMRLVILEPPQPVPPIVPINRRAPAAPVARTRTKSVAKKVATKPAGKSGGKKPPRKPKGK